jgi:hypothetical protein
MKYIPPHLRQGHVPVKAEPIVVKTYGTRFRSETTGLPSSNVQMKFFNKLEANLTRSQQALKNSQNLAKRQIRQNRRTIKSALKGSKKHQQRLTQSVGPNVRKTRKRRASI